MVEVFKTNVEDSCHADLLIEQIHKTFDNYRANFDLEDCDRILRVECKAGNIEPSYLIDILEEFGYDAEILQDEIIPQKDLNIDKKEAYDGLLKSGLLYIDLLKR
ncbi:MAG TPA: hypothetical protein VNS50_13065 [Ginsengibacter sp.]|nr:hypothetical protein [Ginsengibacter sp.]